MNDPEESYTQKAGRGAQRGCALTFLVWIGAIWALVLIEDIPKRAWLEWLSFAAWAMIIFICPAFGILYALEVKDFLGWKGKKSASSLWYRFLIWLGCWLLAATIASQGLFLLLASLDSEKAIMSRGLGVIVGGGLLWGAWFLFALPFRRYRGVTEAQEMAAFDRWKQRLDNPDFNGIEAASGVLLPSGFKEMMQPGSEWRQDGWMLYPLGLENDEVLHMIVEIEPADLESLWRKRNPVTHAEELYLRFASADCSLYLLKLEAGENDPSVFEWSAEHGGVLLEDMPSDGELEKVCDHFSQFIAWPKEKI